MAGGRFLKISNICCNKDADIILLYRRLSVFYRCDMENPQSVLISVIVPIYNSEKFIKRSVGSILRQTYSNLEIILVDDGSTDSTSKILDKYAVEDTRVRVIHKENVGHAHSRNKGLEISTGKFVTFIDSDDYMHPNFIEKMYGAIYEDNSDMACCSFNYVDEQGNKIGWREPHLTRGVVSSQMAQKRFLTSYDIEGFSGTKLVKRSILIENDFRYPEDQKAFVDMFLWYRALSVCDRVSYVPDKLYDYYQMSGSVVHTIDDVKLDNFRTAVSNIRNCAYKNGLRKEGDYYASLRMITQIYEQIRLDVKSGFKNRFFQKYKWNELFFLNKVDTLKATHKLEIQDRLKVGIKFLIVLFYLK